MSECCLSLMRVRFLISSVISCLLMLCVVACLFTFCMVNVSGYVLLLCCCGVVSLVVSEMLCLFWLVSPVTEHFKLLLVLFYVSSCV